MGKDIILSVRPKFVPKIVMFQLIGIGTSAAFTIAIVVEMLFLVLSALFGWNIGIGGMFSVVFLLSAVGVPAFLYEVRRKNQSKTRFNFYDEYVDFSYFAGVFMNRKQGRLYYRDITDMIQYSNFYQNFVNLKTIQLYAPNTSLYQQGQDFIGIQLQDIVIGKGIGRKIQALLDRQHDNQFAVEPSPAPVKEAEVKKKRVKK